MAETTDRRRNNRFAIRLEAFYSSGRVVEDGVLANISYSGALIEDITMQSEIGMSVVLYSDLKPSSAFEAATPFKLAGRVIRHTSTGFAIEYKDNLDADVRRMVDDAASIVAVPR